MLKRSLIYLSLGLALLTVILNFHSPTAAIAATVPANFSDTLLLDLKNPSNPSTALLPTALAFTPDGRLIVLTQEGFVLIYSNKTLTTALSFDDADIALCSGFERGLLGVAVDPDFATNRYIYLYYTFDKFRDATHFCNANNSFSPVNRVVRFVLADNNTINPADQLVLVDNIPSPNGNHNAGDLHFGVGAERDYLYISTGDGGCQVGNASRCGGSNANAQNTSLLGGKILRIKKDGTIPADNPFAGGSNCGNTQGAGGSGACREIFAYGLRNPFRLAFKPNSNEFYINDVGQDLWEEIDVGQKGANYGWNIREGFCANGTVDNCSGTPAGLTDPIYSYSHNDDCASITGGAFVPAGLWPSDFDNVYLFGDYVCGKIFKLVPKAGGGYTTTDFVTNMGINSAVAMVFGPYGTTQGLYYTSLANNLGQVRVISYTGTANRTPTAALRANPTSGASPITVNFDGSGSSDPDGDSLTYIWNFNDGSVVVETATPTIAHTYTAAGSFNPTLTVRDSKGAVSAPVSVRIDSGNNAPVPEILAPTTSTLYNVGQTIKLTGRATDVEDGVLPDSALSWRVILHHNDHTHPFLPPTNGNNINITTNPPEDLEAAKTSYLEIQLTATDSKGASKTISQNLKPNIILVTFNANLPGIKLQLNGQTLTLPQTITSWADYDLNVAAPEQATDSSGNQLVFDSWSDNGTAAHTIKTPAANATYTLNYSVVSVPPGGGNFVHTINPARLYDSRTGASNVPQGGDGALSLNTVRTVQATGKLGIPAGATAILANLTVANADKGGFITVYPTGATDSKTASVNWYSGGARVVSNFALIGLSQDGKFNIKGGGTADVIIDVFGYIDTTRAGGGVFRAVNSPNLRLYDSRSGSKGIQGQGSGPLRQADSSRTIQVTGTGSLPNIPAGALAVIVNLTAADTIKGGYFSLYPTGSKSSVTAVSWNDRNSMPNIAKDVGNLAIVPLSSKGQMDLSAGGNDPTSGANVIIDVVGYVEAAGNSSDGFYFPLFEPSRIYDSRNGTSVFPGGTARKGVLASGEMRQVLARSLAGVPANAKIVVVRVTTVDVSGGGFLSLFAGTNWPGTSTVNTTKSNQQIGNLAFVNLDAAGNFTIYNGSTNPLGVVVDVIGYIL